MSKDLIKFLDMMDKTRDARTVDVDRRGMLWQCGGFRQEWSLYMDGIADNYDHN